MAYFDDPQVRIQEEIDDLREDIGKRQKEVRSFKREIEDLERKKELAESELEDLFKQEKRLKQDATRMRIRGE